MRQAVIEGPGRISVREDAPVPEAGPGEVRIRSSVVGICGSDLSALHGTHPFIDLPVSPGHEVAGWIDSVGDGVEGYEVGDAVLLEPNLVCGECAYCRSGRYNLCEHLAVVGCQTAGALADAFVVPARRLHRVPEGMDMTAAALVEPLSTATHAVRLVGDLAGASVAILGGGSIGLLTMLAARAAGASAVAVTDLAEGKRALAGRLGASLTVDPRAPDAVERIRSAMPPRPDVVFDCVANQSSIDQAIALAVKGGTIVVVGVPHAPVQLALPLVQDRELRLQGTAMYVAQDVRRAIELIQDGTVDPLQLVTASFALQDSERAFAAAQTGENIKVHIDVA
jgi:2-desacetyl-2-hydroxyethyl bacteriochlorophyllide A dehydrogenase